MQFEKMYFSFVLHLPLRIFAEGLINNGKEKHDTEKKKGCHHDNPIFT